jgi:hypothetical protein
MQVPRQWDSSVDVFIFRAWLSGVRWRKYPLALAPDKPKGLLMETFDGEEYAGPGDWVIKSGENDYRVCKSADFEAQFEVMEANSAAEWAEIG